MGDRQISVGTGKHARFVTKPRVEKCGDSLLENHPFRHATIEENDVGLYLMLCKEGGEMSRNRGIVGVGKTYLLKTNSLRSFGLVCDRCLRQEAR